MENDINKKKIHRKQTIQKQEKDCKYKAKKQYKYKICVGTLSVLNIRTLKDVLNEHITLTPPFKIVFIELERQIILIRILFSHASH